MSLIYEKVAKWQNAVFAKKAKNRGTRDFFDQKLHMKKMRFFAFFANLQNCKTAFEWSTKVRIKKTHNLTRESLISPIHK